MKINQQNLTSFILAAIVIVGFSCRPDQINDESSLINPKEETEAGAIFPVGDLGSSENFTGNAYNYGLVPNDSALTTLVGNVFFEPGARSNWHSHPGGQILIITDGEGFHQIEGQAKEILKKGSVAICPPNVRHWHGASPDKGLQQLYIVPNTEKGIVNWQEAVTDQLYTN